MIAKANAQESVGYVAGVNLNASGHTSTTDPNIANFTWIVDPSSPDILAALAPPSYSDTNSHKTSPPDNSHDQTPTSQPNHSTRPLDPKRLANDLRDVFKLAISDLHQALEYCSRSFWRRASAATLSLCSLSLIPLLDPSQLPGIASAGIHIYAASYEKNNHSRALGLVGNVIFMSYLALIGASEGILSLGIGTTRNALQAMMAQDAVKHRIASAFFGVSASTAGFQLVSYLSPPMEEANLLLYASCLSSISGAFPTRWSSASRLCGLVSVIMCIPYYVAKGSDFGVGVSILGIANILRSILIYDISAKKRVSQQDSKPTPT